MCRMYLLPFFLPSGKVLLLWAVYSTARAWIFTGRTRRHRTSTSHKYLFSTFLPASAFIYWLFGDFVWLSGNTQTHKKENRTIFEEKDAADESSRQRRETKRKRFWLEEHFLVCFYIPWELPSPTYPGSQSQLWAFFWSEETQIEEWNKKKRKTEQKKEKRG